MADPALLVEAFDYYAAVTGRHKRWKIKALIKQLDSFREKPEAFRNQDMDSFVQVFDAEAKTAETIGMMKEYKKAKRDLDWYMQKLEESLKKEEQVCP